MFIKLTRCGPNQCVQLVVAYRDEAGRPRCPYLSLLGTHWGTTVVQAIAAERQAFVFRALVWLVKLEVVRVAA